MIPGTVSSGIQRKISDNAAKDFRHAGAKTRSGNEVVRFSSSERKSVFMQIYHSFRGIRDSLRYIAVGCLFGAEYTGCGKCPEKTSKCKGESL